VSQFILISSYEVLHPRHKLDYFKKHNWDEKWIETAREIVRDKFDRSYAGLEAVSEDTMQMDVNDMVHFFLVSSYLLRSAYNT